MKYRYKIKFDIYSDAWNWWDACNQFFHGFDWKAKIEPEIVRNISGKTQEEANQFLIPFLKKRYVNESKRIENFEQYFKNELDIKLEKACDKLAEVMGKQIFRNDFTFFLTTFRRGPYHKDKGLIFMCVYWEDPTAHFLHELCHFQFIHFWREDPNSEVAKLTEAQFEFLKESLTVILDENFFPIIKESDTGYELHQKFRKDLINQWQKDKNFEELVKYGMREIKVNNID